MKLPFTLPLKPKEKSEIFLALLLREEQIKAIIFEEINQKISQLSSHEERINSPLETASDEIWLSVIDKTIGVAENKLPDNVDVKKTIFAVKETWVGDDKIKKEYLAKLKKISEQLDLEPIGFIVFTEAIARFLHTQHGAPVTAILVEVGAQSVILSILRAGKIVQTLQRPIENSVVDTVDIALHSVEAEVLPARIILFDSEHIDKLMREFSNHQWNKNLPFLHIPQIAMLPKNTDAQAVLYGTAIQLGFQMQETNISSLKDDTDLSESQSIIQPDKNQNFPAAEPAENQDENETQVDNFGFKKDTDVALEEPSENHEENNKKETNIEQDGFEKPQNRHLSTNLDNPVNAPQTNNHKPIFSGLFSAFPHLPKLALPKLPFGNKKLLILPVLLVLIIALIIWYIFSVQAIASLTLSPKTIQQDQKVTFSTQDDSNFANNVIHADTNTITEDGNTSVNTTGTKSVGDKAKGTITIYNNNDAPKTLSAGTTITSSTSLKFTLDKDVTIASQSGDIFTGTKPGTADTTVTASDIGTDYNLPSNTTFSTGISNIAAKNASAFSGGTKKNITIVQTKDLESALSQIKSNLDQKAQDEAKNSGSQDSPAIILSSQFTKKKFSKNPGDEASSVSVDATITYTTATISKNSLQDYAKGILKDKIADNQKLSKNGITTQIQDAKAKNDHEIVATLNLQADLFPVLDNKKLASEISGKSFSQALDILTKEPQIGSVTFKLTPDIVFLPKLLPKFPSHIRITSNE